jgi:putative proteasome-type protease
MNVRIPQAKCMRAGMRCRNYHGIWLAFYIFSCCHGLEIRSERSVYYAVGSQSRAKVTYCLGISTREGLVLASDSRTNAGFDQVNVCRKMFRFVQPGERVFVILTSGSLSISQSVITLLGDDFDSGQGLAQANSLYDAARIVGDCVRRISDIDRASLERDSFSFNVHLLLGGQVRGQEPNLYLIYPQGNPLAATEDSLYLQLGECKYGRPILDRGIQASTSLEVAAKYALLSLDATMRSNVTVGPPFDLLLYKKDSLQITRYRRVSAGDRDLNLIHSSWEQSLRRAVEQLPDIEFQPSGNENPVESVREVARSRV